MVAALAVNGTKPASKTKPSAKPKPTAEEIAAEALERARREIRAGVSRLVGSLAEYQRYRASVDEYDDCCEQAVFEACDASRDLADIIHAAGYDAAVVNGVLYGVPTDDAEEIQLGVNVHRKILVV